VAARKAELDDARGKLSMAASPFMTWTLFAKAALDFLSTTALEYAMSREALLFYAALGAYGVSKVAAPELYTPPTCSGKDPLGGAGVLFDAELFVGDVVWWLVLGILSSIGFGTGLHSGIMFLWPHVIQIISKAESCDSTRFAASYNHPCAMQCASQHDGSYSYLNTLLLLLPSVVVWGSGTAIGELPPYFITRAAKQAGKQATDLDEELAEAREQMGTSGIAWLKVKTIEFTEKNGFVGILLLASWPNAAFDMCGMACGWLEMPFWTFFGATLLGKGLVKVTLQSAACIALFGPALFQFLLERVVPQLALPAAACKLAGASAGAECTLAAFLKGGRDKAMLTFALQSRMAPKDLVGSSGLDVKALTKKYCDAAGLVQKAGSWSDPAKHASMVEKAKRAFAALDASGDGKLTVPELGAAVSRSDGKVSLAALDPGTGSVLSPGNLWNGFIFLLVLFFIYSIVEQVAISWQAAADAAALEAYEASLQAEAGAKGVAAKKKKAA